jgi:hypothetical protein
MTATPMRPQTGRIGERSALQWESKMKKILALAVLAFALVAGAAIVVTVYPYQAVAGCTGPGG